MPLAWVMTSGFRPLALPKILYLAEKKRPPMSAYADLRSALTDPDCVIKEAPFTAEVVNVMQNVPRADIPDMPDRIVAATAVFLGVPVISRDGRIRASTIQTVW